MKAIFLFVIVISFNCIPLGFQRTNGPTNGLFFTENKFPGEFNQNNDVPLTKRAEGCLNQILFLVMWGDASAGSIAMENQIKKIGAIDHSTINVLGLYTRYCTIIRGE